MECVRYSLLGNYCVTVEFEIYFQQVVMSNKSAEDDCCLTYF